MDLILLVLPRFNLMTRLYFNIFGNLNQVRGIILLFNDKLSAAFEKLNDENANFYMKSQNQY